jgi:hypothetical protein
LSWMARMLRRGTMIQRVGAPHVFIVCGATSSGVIALKLKPCAVPFKSGEIHRFLTLDVQNATFDIAAAKQLVQFIPIADMQWRCASLTATPPSHVDKDKFESHIDFQQYGILFYPTHIRPMLEFAALRGFKGLTQALVQKLALFLGIVFPRGSTPKNNENGSKLAFRTCFQT